MEVGRQLLPLRAEEAVNWLQEACADDAVSWHGLENWGWPFRRTSEEAGPEPPPQMNNDARGVALLPPPRGTVIDTDRLPIVARGGQPGEEYPARGFDVETGILFQPMANMSLRPTG